MKAVFLRADSVPIQASFGLCSVKVSLSNRDSATGILFYGKSSQDSPRPSSLHMKIKDQRNIKRVFSETDIVLSRNEVSRQFSRLNGAGSRSFPARIPEEDYVSEGDENGGRSLDLKQKGFDRGNSTGILPGSHVTPEELVFSGDGERNGRSGRGAGDDNWTGELTGGSADRSKIGAYYEQMLKVDPWNPLLLRNYGKFLHQVEKDLVRVEEYYGRAILASPGDGDVLSSYGKLIWERNRDEGRARAYFDLAVQASPDDCYVLGSYAQFLWDSEEEDKEEGKKP